MEKFLKTNRSTLLDRKKLTTNAAKRYYGILMKCCGASPRKLEKETFIYHYAVCPSAEAEYVFKNSNGEYWRFVSSEIGNVHTLKVELCKDNKNKFDMEAESRANMVLSGIRKKIDIEFRSKEGIEFKRK
jgi:hypothetical protein